MTQFSDLKLDPKVLQAISDAGYTTPTPIQAGAIPPALEGRDVLGIAQTGTGKTASFTLPMITLLGRGRARARMPRSLVLCPTRELAAQVAENFDVYAKQTRLTKALLIGGVSMKDQELLINRGVDVLIATPGRLLDHFERGNLLLQGVQIMVVDEADRMLDMGFIPDIERIFQLTPFTRQTLFFSATMAPEIERITDTFLHAPVRIEVARQATTSDTITQKLVEITPTRKDQTAKQKRELLRAVIRAEEAAPEGLKNAIIFCNRKTEVDIVAKSLKAHGLDAAPIHGDLDQAQRTRTLDGFREGTLRFLVASDVAARGLDIPAVSHVFNFDLPSHAEDYVHRIGRTGRAGRQGTAISLAVPADEKYLAAIESLVKHALPRVPAPAGFALSEAATEAPAPRDEGRGRGPRSRTRGPRARDDERRSEPRPGAEDVTTTVPTAAAEPAPEAPMDDRRAEPRRETRDEPRREGREGRGERRDDRRSERGGERRDERGGERREVARDERGGERRDERRADTRRDERGEGRNDERRDERRNGRDDRRGNGGGGVVGLGEHVPDFMNRSFRASLARTIGGTDTDDGGSAPVAADQAEPRESRAPREARDDGDGRTSGRNRSRRGRGRGERGERGPRGDEARADVTRTDEALVEEVRALEAGIEAQVEAAPQVAPAVEAEPLPETIAAPETALPDAAPALVAVALPELEAEPVSEPVLDETVPPVDFEEEAAAPAKPRKPRASRAKPDPDASPKPKRTRAKAQPASDEAADAAASVEVETAKPKRTRSRKPKADAEAATGGASEAPTGTADAGGQAAPAKPRRTRARKQASEAAGSDAGAAGGRAPEGSAETPADTPADPRPADV